MLALETVPTIQIRHSGITRELRAVSSRSRSPSSKPRKVRMISFSNRTPDLWQGEAVLLPVEQQVAALAGADKS